MRKSTLLVAASAVAIAGAGLSLLKREGSPPPEMDKKGEATDNGTIVKKKTIDYESVVRQALTERARFITLTLAREVIRDEQLETSIAYTPLPTSTARLRVRYHVEYAIGYELGPRHVWVDGGSDGLIITLRRPQLVARPSVRLLSYKVLDSGYLIDEKTALLKLQQRIQPEAEKRGSALLARADVVPRSERMLRGFLQPLLAKAAEGQAPPSISFRYR